MNSNLINQLMEMGKNKPVIQSPPLDPQRFVQLAQKLTKENLVQLVKQAQQQGIPDNQIEQGLNYLFSLK